MTAPTQNSCEALKPLMDSTGLDTVAFLYKVWFWVLVGVAILLWMVAMFLLLLPNTTRIYNYILRLFISLDFQYEEIKTEMEESDTVTTRPRRESNTQRAMKRHKREHLGFSKIYHVQKSQTAIGGIITVFVLLVAVVLVTNSIVTFMDPTKQQIYPSALVIQEEDDLTDNNGTIVPIHTYALFNFEEVGPIHCQIQLVNMLQISYTIGGETVENVNVSNAHITPYKTTPSSCLVQWDNYILLNPTYQAPSSRSLRAGSSDTLPRKYSVSISWQKPSNLRLQELLFKSEVAYFNDDSKTEQRKVKNSRLGKFLFSQRQYCLPYSTAKSAESTSTSFSVRILSYIFQRNWLYQSNSYYLPFSQTLAFPQNKRRQNPITNPTKYQHAISFSLVDGDTFSVVFPSSLSLVLSIFSILGGVMATIPLSRYFVNKFMKLFYSYMAFRIIAVLLLLIASGLGASSFLVLRNMYDQWIIITVLLSVFPLMGAIGLIVHAAYVVYYEREIREQMEKYRSTHLQPAAIHQTISEQERKLLAESFGSTQEYN